MPNTTITSPTPLMPTVVSVPSALDAPPVSPIQPSRTVTVDAVGGIAAPSTLVVPPAPPGATALPALGRPGRPKGVVAVRVSDALESTRAALVERRAGYAQVIARHEETIRSLETELAAVSSRIATKTGDVRDLVAKKQRLASEIADNRRLAAVAAGYGALLGIFSFGATALIGGGVAASAAVAIAALTSDLSTAERAENEARATLRDLERSSEVFQGAQAAARTRLAALAKERGALQDASPVVPADAPPREVVRALEAAVENDVRIIANLEEQIATLKRAKVGALAHEASLDKTIARLEADVAALEVQVTASRRALVSTLIDLALVGFGATGALKKVGIPFSEKALILAGLDLTSGDPKKVAADLVGQLVSASLVKATDSALLGETLAALTTRAITGADAKAKVEAVVLAAVKPLTATHRGLLERLADVKTFDPEPLARAVVDSELTRSEALAISRILDHA